MFLSVVAEAKIAFCDSNYKMRFSNSRTISGLPTSGTRLQLPENMYERSPGLAFLLEFWCQHRPEPVKLL
jgi:hypothetical protein